MAAFFATRTEHEAGCPVLGVREKKKQDGPRSCVCAAGLARRHQADALISSHLLREGAFFEGASLALFGTLHDELDVEARSRFIQAYGYVVKEINGGVFRSNAALRRGPRRKRERRAHSCSRATKAT